jgi:hypothetical protein
MCDGNLREKLEIIKSLVVIDKPAEPQEYISDHLVWSVRKLKSYRTRRTRMSTGEQ